MKTEELLETFKPYMNEQKVIKAEHIFKHLSEYVTVSTFTNMNERQQKISDVVDCKMWLNELSEKAKLIDKI